MWEGFERSIGTVVQRLLWEIDLMKKEAQQQQKIPSSRREDDQLTREQRGMQTAALGNRDHAVPLKTTRSELWKLDPPAHL